MSYAKLMESAQRTSEKLDKMCNRKSPEGLLPACRCTTYDPGFVFSHVQDPSWLLRGQFFRNYYVGGW